MIKVEHISVWGFEHAIRGMRNPMNSWEKSDSAECYDGWLDDCDSCPLKNKCSISEEGYIIGKNDLDLMHKLYKAGTEHRKYLRQIFVSMDITAPLYWWKEFDTYKIGTVSNSCSTMHKIHAKEFELDDFSHEHLLPKHDIQVNNMPIPMPFDFTETLDEIIDALNMARDLYLQSKDKNYWWQMIQLLPSSYNQRRTITMNYENVMSIINQRSTHKLDEWRMLVAELQNLPYIEGIIDGNEVGCTN